MSWVGFAHVGWRADNPRRPHVVGAARPPGTRAERLGRRLQGRRRYLRLIEILSRIRQITIDEVFAHTSTSVADVRDEFRRLAEPAAAPTWSDEAMADALAEVGYHPKELARRQRRT